MWITTDPHIPGESGAAVAELENPISRGQSMAAGWGGLRRSGVRVAPRVTCGSLFLAGMRYGSSHGSPPHSPRLTLPYLALPCPAYPMSGEDSTEISRRSLSSVASPGWADAKAPRIRRTISRSWLGAWHPIEGTGGRGQSKESVYREA